MDMGIFFEGDARLFEGEASPTPPVDETLIAINLIPLEL